MNRIKIDIRHATGITVIQRRVGNADLSVYNVLSYIQYDHLTGTAALFNIHSSFIRFISSTELRLLKFTHLTDSLCK